MVEEITLEILLEEGFSNYEIRPMCYDLSDKRVGNKVLLTVNRPMQFTFEADGYHNALHIFANAPSLKPEEVCIYYGKGEHDEGLIWLESNQTLYLEEGATVYGTCREGIGGSRSEIYRKSCAEPLIM